MKPWSKATGSKTPQDKAKVRENLPHGKGESNRVVKGLVNLDEALQKLQRLEERIRKRQSAAITKLEKIARKGEKS